MSKTNAQQPSLPKIIATDIVTEGRLAFLLLMIVFATAISVIFITHSTRAAITTKNEVLNNRDKLDTEWRNLLLEETAQSEHSRIQDIATEKLNMIRPDATKEVIVELK